MFGFDKLSDKGFGFGFGFCGDPSELKGNFPFPAFAGMGAGLVVVVDPTDPDDLEKAATELLKKADEVREQLENDEDEEIEDDLEDTDEDEDEDNDEDEDVVLDKYAREELANIKEELDELSERLDSMVDYIEDEDEEVEAETPDVNKEVASKLDKVINLLSEVSYNLRKTDR